MGFVYQRVELQEGSGPGQESSIEILVAPHAGMRAKCSQCRRPAPGYDRLEERIWLHVPLWGIPTRFHYAPRRVECPEHGWWWSRFPGARGSVRSPAA